MKLFVSYQVNQIDKEAKVNSVFGNTVIETADPEKVTYEDIRGAEVMIRDAWKTVGATVISFHRIDD